jgi:hypothetical protein
LPGISTDGFAALVRDDRVQARVYTDPAVFAAETVRIFARAWCYVGHESQVPQPGSFIRASIANRPLLMVRGDDGAIAVLHNRCPHRGALLVGERCGHATRLSTMFYPSASVQATSLQMRVIVPEAVDSTPIEVWTLRLAGAPDSAAMPGWTFAAAAIFLLLP